MFKKILSLFILFAFLFSCSTNKLPKEKYSQASFSSDIKYIGDTLSFHFSNPLHTPWRLSVSSQNRDLQELVRVFDTILLEPEKDTIIEFIVHNLKNEKFKFHTAFGNPEKEVRKIKMALPFPSNRSYKIIQGSNGKFSHNSDYSRYAIDFNLKEGDTVCSADDGFVVGVIKDYKAGGSTSKWRDYANFITIYHPHSNLYTQYVHLMHQGSFVKVGDEVYKGQPIGLSGLTGFTTREHLHFNVLQPWKRGLISTDIEFEERE